MSMNVKGTRVKMEGSVQIWWPITPVNVQANTWEETVNTVSTVTNFLSEF